MVPGWKLIEPTDALRALSVASPDNVGAGVVVVGGVGVGGDGVGDVGCVGVDDGDSVGDGVTAATRENCTLVSDVSPFCAVTTMLASLVTPTDSVALVHVLPAVYGPLFIVIVAWASLGTALSAILVTV